MFVIKISDDVIPHNPNSMVFGVNMGILSLMQLCVAARIVGRQQA
jgi:hypothetical protein